MHAKTAALAMLIMAVCSHTAAAVNTISMEAMASVNSATPTLSYVTNGSQLPFTTGWEIVAKPSQIYAGMQIHAGSGMLTLTGIDDATPGVVFGNVFVTSVAFSPTTALTYAAVQSAGKILMGTEKFTVTSAGMVYVTDNGFEAALDYTFNHPGTSVVIDYAGNAGPYEYGPAVGQPLAPLTTGILEAVPTGVPEPSTYALMALGFVGLFVVLRRRIRVS